MWAAVGRRGGDCILRAFLFVIVLIYGLALIFVGATSASGPNERFSLRRCEAAGKSEITVTCDYSAEQFSDRGDMPRIALDRAVITFRPRDESRMQVKLTFRNIGKRSLKERRSVYIEFDDIAGKNYIRRPLHHVDLRQLAPGERKEFDEVLLVPALRPNRYVVRLWIPDPKSAVKFNPAHSLLLSTIGVPDEPTGTNQIAAITVEP